MLKSDVHMRMKFLAFILSASLCTLFLSGCSEVNVADARAVDIPAPVGADVRRKAINERPESVMYLPLGEDVLVPEVFLDDSLPSDIVGPFELRGETLAGALQLILADYDISLAFETDAGLDRKVTVANLHGPLNKVVRRVCSLANLYCAYEDDILVIKDTQTFTVSLPPIGGAGDTGEEFLTNVSKGLAAVLGGGAAPIVDPTTRTLVYQATQRNAELAARYFQRLRANTAMIVFETYIWEVSLNSGNSMGVDWSTLDTIGKFDIAVDGAIGANFTNPVGIGLPTGSLDGTPDDIVNFLSKFGAVKAISQPQITVLSGSKAELRVAKTNNYVSEINSTLTDTQTTTSVNTDSVDSGFTLSIGSSWNKSTVYADIVMSLTNVLSIDNFVFSDGGNNGTSTTIQLPQTTERELTTQIRVRPGDSVLIAGLVQEKDNFDKTGPGFMEPVLPQSRTAEAENLELVILLRPRVVTYTAPPAHQFNATQETEKKVSVKKSTYQNLPPKSIPLKAGAIVERETVVPAPAAVAPTPTSTSTSTLSKPVVAAPAAPKTFEVAPAPAPVTSPTVSKAISRSAESGPVRAYVPSTEREYDSGYRSRYLDMPKSTSTLPPPTPALAAPQSMGTSVSPLLSSSSPRFSATSPRISPSSSVEIYDNLEAGASLSTDSPVEIYDPSSGITSGSSGRSSPAAESGYTTY